MRIWNSLVRIVAEPESLWSVGVNLWILETPGRFLKKGYDQISCESNQFDWFPLFYFLSPLLDLFSLLLILTNKEAVSALDGAIDCVDKLLHTNILFKFFPVHFHQFSLLVIQVAQLHFIQSFKIEIRSVGLFCRALGNWLVFRVADILDWSSRQTFLSYRAFFWCRCRTFLRHGHFEIDLIFFFDHEYLLSHRWH
jgi:hypothetical protein